MTDWLGWQTSSLIPNHTSKLGYPCNLDRCQKMQVVMLDNRWTAVLNAVCGAGTGNCN